MPDHVETLAVHAGVEPDPTTGAVMTPIYQTSTYAQEDVGAHKGYDYSRTDNATRSALQSALAALEGGRHALAFGSGVAAVGTVLRLLRPGQHVRCGVGRCGGTLRPFDRLFSPFGLQFSYVDTTSLDAVAAAIRPETKLIWLETPTNPMLRITDIAAVAGLAREA